MYKALMETVSRSELTPISHRISDITPGAAAGRRNYSIALHTEPVRSGALMLLFRVNVKIPLGCGLSGCANRNRGSHQAAIAFHDINILVGKGYQYAHG